jgi:hypothetical protein
MAMATACARFCASSFCLILLACHITTLSLRFRIVDISHEDFPSVIHFNTSNSRGVIYNALFVCAL